MAAHNSHSLLECESAMADGCAEFIAGHKDGAAQVYQDVAAALGYDIVADRAIPLEGHGDFHDCEACIVLRRLKTLIHDKMLGG